MALDPAPHQPGGTTFAAISRLAATLAQISLELAASDPNSRLFQTAQTAYKALKEILHERREGDNLSIGQLSRLRYSIDLIGQLADTVIRQRAKNPLISDDLVSVVSNAKEEAEHTLSEL